MLTALSIRDIVLIDKLDLEFGAGLSVLTGETGAGKSILLDAFALAIGARGDSALVRQGKAEGQVTAVFEPRAGHPAFALLQDAGVPADAPIVLRRVQSADGRSKAFVNDSPVGVQLLRRVGATLVEIHGQHDERALLDASGHRDLLDAFGGLGAEARGVADAYAVRQSAAATLAAARARIEKARAEADYIRHATDELHALDPKAAEEEALAERRQMMMHAERIAQDLEEAFGALAGDAASGARLNAAVRRVERQAAQAPGVIEPVARALDRVLVETDEARRSIETALRELAFEPGELEAAEERLFALRAAARKYQVGVDALPALLARFEAELEALDAGETELGALEAVAAEAAEAYRGLAARLSDARRKAAAKLDTEVVRELGPLKLERARFLTGVETRPPEEGGPGGVDHVSFTVQMNPGTEPGPLIKVASGGELARVVLGLKVTLAARGSAPTLVFDEIDTGVGGATAAAIGQRLARLAESLQVLAVTHAPQVAAAAERHVRISKELVGARKDETVVTRVAVLEPGDRREEIARMLSGRVVTDEARAAAARLIAGQA